MTRRIRLVFGILTLAVLPMMPACTSSTPSPPIADAAEEQEPQVEGPHDKDGILVAVIKLIHDAATTPGGDSFNIATENLNAYFQDTKTEEFGMSEDLLQFLQTQIQADAINTIRRRQFIPREDGRHIEDNLLYQAVANRVAGEGDDLTRATRLFDWVTRHVMLVPAGSLAPPGIQQAQARPYDVMLRGMGTEDGTGWSERSWLFMVLCRQVGLDAGLIVLVPARTTAGPIPAARAGGLNTFGWTLAAAAPQAREPRPWAVAVLVGGKPYMFDPAIGLPIPSPDGKGVATLEQAVTDPSVLAQLDLPGRDYEPNQVDLARGTFRVLFESSLGTLAPRMRLLQSRLTSKNRMILYRDPIAQGEAFKHAMGERCSAIGLWSLPLMVEHRLFNPGPGNFIDATLFPLRIFEKRWPLLSARLMQLRGEMADSVQSYVVFRYAEAALESDGKTRIPPQVQVTLDLFATYFLALAQMEKGDIKQSKDLFGQTLAMMPEPDPRLPYFLMFRWGASANLGLLNAKSGNLALAVRYLAQDNPTLQSHGNLLRARKLIFENPFVPPKETPKVVPPPALPTSAMPRG